MFLHILAANYLNLKEEVSKETMNRNLVNPNKRICSPTKAQRKGSSCEVSLSNMFLSLWNLWSHSLVKAQANHSSIPPLKIASFKRLKHEGAFPNPWSPHEKKLFVSLKRLDTKEVVQRLSTGEHTRSLVEHSEENMLLLSCGPGLGALPLLLK